MESDPPDPNDEEAVLSIDFGRYLDALRKYAWAVVAITALAIAGAVVYTNRQTEVFQAQASIQIEPRIPDLLGQGQGELLRGGGGTADYYKQQKQVLGSYSLVRQTVDEHRLYLRVLTELERGNRKVDEMIDLATGRIRATLSVKYPDQDRIMYVVVRDSSPQLAADIANAHVATYVQYSKGLLSMDTKQASSALTTEFDDAETKLRTAEAALYQYQKDNDLLAVTLEERQSMVSTGITTYTAKLTEAHGKRIELSALFDRMQRAQQADVLQSPILSMGGADKTSFDSLRAQYYSERNKFIELEKEVGQKNPQYQMQKAKTDDLYSALETEAKRMVAVVNEQLQAVIATEASLKAEVEKATKEAIALGPKVVEYNELLRKKKSLEDRYNILRTRLSTTDLTDRMSRNMDSTNVRPLDLAQVPTVPVSPNLRTNILTATALAVLLGLGLVFLIVFLDRSIKTTEDALQLAAAPILGIIPLLEEIDQKDVVARDLFVHKNPTSLVAECCRSMRTNIMFSAADRQIKTIVVSSANQGEGKTTSVIYLGTTMAQSGQRVLLVDTDMRRPRLHVSTGVPRQVGLSNLLVGNEDYDDVIKTTEIPNLFVLPCGPTPPNPAELLMSHRFDTVLGELAKRFDRIILDSPPIQVVTDGVVLSKHADGVILIVKAGQTLREELRRSARTIRNVGGTIFGVIVNGVEPDSRNGYSYYSYYGYTEKTPELQQP